MDPVIIILWFLMSALIGIKYAYVCVGQPIWKCLLCSMIFLAGGPFFVLVNILECLLDALFPDGWEDDDNDFRSF